jgi:hypothetical protein
LPVLWKEEMSYYSNDLYGESQQRKTLLNRDKINSALFSDFDVNTFNKQKCDICNTKLIFKDSILWCKDCGKVIPISEVKQEKKLRSRFGTNKSVPAVMSLKKRSKHDSINNYEAINSNLTEEDKAELRSYGYSV